MRHKILFIAATVTVLSGVGLSQPAQATELVQLKEFMVQVVNKRAKRTSQMPITVLFEIKSAGEVKSLCKFAPRYREAILSQLSRTRYPLTAKGKLNVSAIQKELEPVVKKADRNKFVLKVKVSSGYPRLKNLDARYFNRTGCIQVK